MGSFMSKQKLLPRYFHEGDTVVDSSLVSLVDSDGSKCEVELKKIGIYKTPLGHDPRQQEAGASKKPLQVYHHFLMVEVSRCRHPEWGELQGFKIRAEKLGPDPESKGLPGIRVNNVAGIMGAEEHYSFDTVDKPILLKKLIEILTTHNPDYDLLRDNCWKYADTTCNLLRKTLMQVQQQGQPSAAPASGNDKKQKHMNIGAGGNEKLAANLREMPPLVMPIDRIIQIAAGVVAVGALTWAFIVGIEWLRSSEDEEDKEEQTKVPA